MAVATKNRIAESNGKHQSAEVVKIKPIERRTFQVTIRGTSPLIVSKFSEKAKRQIEEKQQKKAKTAREKRDPKAEYKAACYMMPGSPEALKAGAKYAIPAQGIKNACVSACKFIEGMPMTRARGAFFIFDLDGTGSWLQIQNPKKSKKVYHPVMREDTVRLASPSRPLDLRYRPEFTEWQVTFLVEYNASFIVPEQIVNLLNVAGFAVGLHEWRPEKNGMFGMFEVVSS